MIDKNKCYPKSVGDQDLHVFEHWFFHSCNPIYRDIWVMIVYNIVTCLIIYCIIRWCKKKLSNLMDPSINGNGVTIYSIFIFKFIQIEMIAYIALLVANSIFGLLSFSAFKLKFNMENEELKIT